MDLREVRAIENFLASLDDPEAMEKVAQKIGGYIKKRVREDGFARRILPPEVVTPAECQVGLDHDGLIKVVRLEPEVGAMVLTWRGQMEPQYLEADRAALGFHTIASKEITKTEQELLAYGSGIEQLIEQFSIKDIHEKEDGIFMAGVGSAILKQSQATRNLAKSSTGDTIQPEDLRDLMIMLSQKKLALTTLLMSYSTFAEVNVWDSTDVGNDVKSEVTINGFKYPTLHGYRLVLSNKNDLLPEGWIFGYADPEYMGEFDVLNDIKFYVEKKKNLVSWAAAEDVGMILANIESCACIVPKSTPDVTTAFEAWIAGIKGSL